MYVGGSSLWRRSSFSLLICDVMKIRFNIKETLKASDLQIKLAVERVICACRFGIFCLPAFPSPLRSHPSRLEFLLLKAEIARYVKMYLYPVSRNRRGRNKRENGLMDTISDVACFKYSPS